MYRAVALAAKSAGIAWSDGRPRRRAGRRARRTERRSVVRAGRRARRARVASTAQDVTDAIRTPDMGMGASTVSAHKAGARRAARPAAAGRPRGGVVLEGRDIGTVVFPDAEVKFFLTARPEVRAKPPLRRARREGGRRSPSRRRSPTCAGATSRTRRAPSPRCARRATRRSSTARTSGSTRRWRAWWSACASGARAGEGSSVAAIAIAGAAVVGCGGERAAGRAAKPRARRAALAGRHRHDPGAARRRPPARRCARTGCTGRCCAARSTLAREQSRVVAATRALDAMEDAEEVIVGVRPDARRATRRVKSSSSCAACRADVDPAKLVDADGRALGPPGPSGRVRELVRSDGRSPRRRAPRSPPRSSSSRGAPGSSPPAARARARGPRSRTPAQARPALRGSTRARDGRSPSCASTVRPSSRASGRCSRLGGLAALGRRLQAVTLELAAGPAAIDAAAADPPTSAARSAASSRTRTTTRPRSPRRPRRDVDRSHRAEEARGSRLARRRDRGSSRSRAEASESLWVTAPLPAAPRSTALLHAGLRQAARHRPGPVISRPEPFDSERRHATCQRPEAMPIRRGGCSPSARRLRTFNPARARHANRSQSDQRISPKSCRPKPPPLP